MFNLFRKVSKALFGRRSARLIKARCDKVIAVEKARSASESRESLIRRLKVLAYTDPLTGFNNRHALTKKFADRSNAGDKSTLAIIAFDLDNFRDINTNHGHAGGDAVLEHFAKAVRDNTRYKSSTKDFMTRVGGEEFYIFMDIENLEDAIAKAEMLRSLFEKTPCKYGDHIIPVTASFGVAIYNPLSGETYQEAMKRADAACYESKHAGRNCVTPAISYKGNRQTGLAPTPARRIVFGKRKCASAIAA